MPFYLPLLDKLAGAEAQVSHRPLPYFSPVFIA